MDIKLSEKNYFNPKDLQKLEILQKNINDKYKVYNNVRNQIINTPKEKINSAINLNEITYDQSDKYIKELSIILQVANSELQNLEGNNPILVQEFEDLKPQIKERLDELHRIRELIKPLTSSNLTEYLTNQAKKLSIAQIFQYFEEVDRRLVKSDQWSEMPDFQSIFESNVYEYFNLKGVYSSDLKKRVFEKTSEYQNYLNELTQKRSEILSNFYYHKGFNRVRGETFTTERLNLSKGTTHFIINYDLRKKGFLISIGDVLPYYCSVSFMPKIISQLEFLNLPTSKVYDLTNNSENSYREIFLITVSEEVALEMENNRSNIEVLLLFQMKGIEKRKLNDIDFRRDTRNNNGCKELVDVVATKNLKLIVYNNSTNKIYFDKIY